MVEIEKWLPVAGYDGRYEVSEQGHVRSLFVGTPRLRLTRLAKNGYARVNLALNGVTTTHSIHRLVAAAFIGHCPEGCQVNHIDGDKKNNRAANLEYVTARQNSHHASRSGLKPAGERHPLRRRPELARRGEQINTAKLTAASVRQIRQEAAELSTPYPRLAARYGVNAETIGRIVRRQSWRHV